MRYVLTIVVPPVPPYNHDAYGFADALLRESKGMPPAPRLIQFHDAITGRFPCASTGAYGADEDALCPWGDSPLMACFSGDVGVISIVARNVEVIPILLRRAGALALTVIDEQAAWVHRPATFCITIAGIQKNVDHNAMVAKLVPLLKRSREDVLELLATPNGVVKRRLDHVTAQRFCRTLDLIGCDCNIEKEVPELGVTIPISGPRAGVAPAGFSLAENEEFDSSLPQEKKVSWPASWLLRAWGKLARRPQY